MEIIRKSSKFITILNFDEIPFVNLLLTEQLNSLKEKFKFSNFEFKEVAPTALPKIVFVLGEMNDGNKIIVKKLTIEERKIVIEVEGDTADAEKVYSQLILFLKTISSDASNADWKSLVATYESEVVVRLDFSAESLIDNRIMKLLKNDLSKEATTKQGVASVRLDAISFVVDYQVADDSLPEYKIGLSPKDFVLAPRPGQPLEKRLFVSKAPLESKAHLRLLEQIEKLMK